MSVENHFFREFSDPFSDQTFAYAARKIAHSIKRKASHLEGLGLKSARVQVLKRGLLRGSPSLWSWAFSLGAEKVRQNMPVEIQQLPIADSIAFNRTVVG